MPAAVAPFRTQIDNPVGGFDDFQIMLDDDNGVAVVHKLVQHFKQAPHILVAVFGRGMLKQLFTRAYFEDEATANAADPILALVPEARRGTLVANRQGDTYTLDIRLQGEGETVFFAV